MPGEHGPGEEFLELPLLMSSRHLAALETAAFRQGVTVGPLLRRLIRDYLAVLRERGLESDRSAFVVRLPRTTPTENRNGTLRADEV
jgi:hypothetical protein